MPQSPQTKDKASTADKHRDKNLKSSGYKIENVGGGVLPHPCRYDKNGGQRQDAASHKNGSEEKERYPLNTCERPGSILERKGKGSIREKALWPWPELIRPGSPLYDQCGPSFRQGTQIRSSVV
jgi:hypothetical protein